MSPRAARVARSWPTLLLLAACAGFIALGIWQVQRRTWKLDLIQRVESRVHAAPVAAPPPALWRDVSAARDEYRHVVVRGRYLEGKDTRVQAVTTAGAGFWMLTPLRADDGTIVLVNRGFVPPRWRDVPAADDLAAGRVSVTGLLRITEPGGGFLRDNAPAQDRWHSRDVRAIAVSRGLDRVAPYFIDADRAATSLERAVDDADPSRYPLGGLTVVSFHNNHLVYALTWFGLALMSAGAAWRVTMEQRRRHRRQEPREHGQDNDERRAA